MPSVRLRDTIFKLNTSNTVECGVMYKRRVNTWVAGL